MTIVSFETAQKLKKAGFPQPKFEFGQAWWMNVDPYSFTESIVTLAPSRIGDEAIFSIDEGETFVSKECDQIECFAPTATDILMHLDCHDLHFDKSRKEWSCWWDAEKDDSNDFFNTNPAEVCAQAWLSLQTPTEN